MSISSDLRRCPSLVVAFIACFLLVAPVTGQAFSLGVAIDTTVLSGTSAILAFDLVDGDTAVDSTVTISGFASDGVLGAASTVGAVSGALPGIVTLTDGDFFNELAQNVALGSFISFTLEATAAVTGIPGPIPDSFAIFLLDPETNLSLVTTDLLGDALLIIDLSGPDDIATFRSGVTTPNVPGIVVTTPAPSTVPEPSMMLPLLAGLACLGAIRRRWRPGAAA